MTEERLSRIESKVDKLVDAMAELIRFEEKMAQCKQDMDRIQFRQDDLETRVEEIEKKMPVINIALAIFGKVGLTIITLITAGIIGSFFVF